MAPAKKLSSAKTTKPSSSVLSRKDKVSRGYGHGLVGSRIKVWWPLDRQFYEGVVDSYVSSKKKHRVLYDDGDKETLDMKKERWEILEEDEAEADEISIQDASADESSEATPEPLTDDMPKKKEKKDSSANSNSKAKSGKIPDNTEEEREKPTSGVKKADKSKNVEKMTPKPETEKDGKMGDIGGKIVAAASRMSGRTRSKENGHEKERPKTLKSRKEVSTSKSQKPRTSLKTSKKVAESQQRPSSSSEAVSEDGDDAENDTSGDEAKSGMKMSPSKEKDQAKETSKALKAGKKVSELKTRKLKRSASSSEAVSLKKKPRTSSKKSMRNNNDDGDVDDEDGDEEANEAPMEKVKGKKEKEAGEGSSEDESEAEEEGKKEKEVGEGSSGNETEAEEEGKKEKEAGEESSGNETEAEEESS